MEDSTEQTDVNQNRSEKPPTVKYGENSGQNKESLPMSPTSPMEAESPEPCADQGTSATPMGASATPIGACATPLGASQSTSSSLDQTLEPQPGLRHRTRAVRDFDEMATRFHRADPSENRPTQPYGSSRPRSRAIGEPEEPPQSPYRFERPSRPEPREDEEEMRGPMSPRSPLPAGDLIVQAGILGTGLLGAGIAGKELVGRQLRQEGLCYTASGDSLSTAALARPIWRELGCFDMEVSMGTESDFLFHKRACTKNPNHRMFRSLHDFNVRDLPIEYRDQQFFDFIKLSAEVVAHVVVDCVSPNRPSDYLLYNQRGRKFLRAGTGWFCGDYKITSGGKGGDCPCPECKLSGKPKDTWGIFELCTSSMFVYDIYEAESTTVKLFYNDEKYKERISVLYGMYPAPEQRHSSDLMYVSCCTHDMNAILSLSNYIPNVKRLHKEMVWHFSKKEKLLALIISHPHGRSKKISFGTELYRRKIMILSRHVNFTAYTYYVSTCRGSCGAPVRVYGNVGYIYKENHVHIESERDNRGRSGMAVECDPRFISLPDPFASPSRAQPL